MGHLTMSLRGHPDGGGSLEVSTYMKQIVKHSWILGIRVHSCGLESDTNRVEVENGKGHFLNLYLKANIHQLNYDICKGGRKKAS